MVIASIDRPNGTGDNDFIPGYYPKGAEDVSAPSVEDILSIFKDGKTYYADFHRNCKEEEDYLLGRRPIAAPKGIDVVWPATANGIIDTATDHVDVNNIAIDVPSSPRSRARAERLKKFYLGVWLSVKKPVLRTAVRQAFIYGISFMKDMFNADKWPNAPRFSDFNSESDYKDALAAFQETQCIRWPFDISVVRPTNLIWDDSRTRMKWVIEFYNRPVRDLIHRYPEWAPSLSSMQSGLTEWVEYWDEEWCEYIADGQLLEKFRHNYGHNPYTQIIPANSSTYEDGPPDERYRGMLRPAHNLLDEEARLTTQISATIKTTAYRTLDFTSPNKKVAQEVAEQYELFGGKNLIWGNVTVDISPMTQVPPDLYQQLSVVQAMIERVTFSNVLRGDRSPGVNSGFHSSVLAGMSRLKLQGVVDGLRHGVEQVNSKLAQLVENKVRGRVTVYARNSTNTFDQTIEPDDIRGVYENIVQMRAEAPEESERTSLLAMRLLSTGIISLQEAMRRAGIADPLEEMMIIKSEQIVNSQPVTMGQIQATLELSGLPQQLEASVSPQLGGGSGNVGSENVGGAQLPQLGQANNQQARIASNPNTGAGAQPSVFPQGFSGVDSLGAILGGATGGAQGVPSGQTIRRGR